MNYLYFDLRLVEHCKTERVSDAQASMVGVLTMTASMINGFLDERRQEPVKRMSKAEQRLINRNQ